MKVDIYSRKTIEQLLKDCFLDNVAVISFYDPELIKIDKDYAPVNFQNKSNRVFLIGLPDIDIDSLEDFGLTYETFFPEAHELARFINSSYNDGLDIICQCEYGESRSAGCAAAILEHFYKSGISIFADYRYCPNQMVYHKVFDSLKIVSTL